MDTGQWDKADAAYAFLQAHPPEAFWQANVEKEYAESLLMRGLDAEVALSRAETLARQNQKALIYRQVQGLRGEAALRAGDPARALTFFEDYLKLCRQAGSDVDEALGRLARVLAQLGEVVRCREILESNSFDGEEIINAAEAYLTLGDRDQAREAALKAYQRAWMDGEPFVWRWGLERAQAVLDALGEPHPVLPRFNPDNVGQFAYEAEIRAHLAELQKPSPPD
jgi:tetratricopeptide (TPR) repeat protein